VTSLTKGNIGTGVAKIATGFVQASRASATLKAGISGLGTAIAGLAAKAAVVAGIFGAIALAVASAVKGVKTIAQ